MLEENFAHVPALISWLQSVMTLYCHKKEPGYIAWPMRSPEVTYLEDVLGIEGFIKPAANRTVTKTQQKLVVALSDVPLINGRMELLKKMLASIHINDFIALDCSRDEQEKVEALEPTAAIFLGEKVSSVVESWSVAGKFTGIKRAILPSLEELTDTSDQGRLMTLKKQAWASLQNFQKEI